MASSALCWPIGWTFSGDLRVRGLGSIERALVQLQSRHGLRLSGYASGADRMNTRLKFMAKAPCRVWERYPININNWLALLFFTELCHFAPPPLHGGEGQNGRACKLAFLTGLLYMLLKLSLFFWEGKCFALCRPEVKSNLSEYVMLT